MSADPHSGIDENRRIAEDHYYAGLDLFSEGKYAEAIERYQQAIESDPIFTDAMHALARAFQDAGRLDDAIAIAQKIADIDPNDTLAHTSLSIFYQRKGMVPEAEAEANKARILGWKQQLQEKKRQQG